MLVSFPGHVGSDPIVLPRGASVSAALGCFCWSFSFLFIVVVVVVTVFLYSHRSFFWFSFPCFFFVSLFMIPSVSLPV